MSLKVFVASIVVLEGVHSTLSRCSSEDISFQLVTGRVYQNQKHILETKPGMLELSSCLSLCRSLSNCQSVNYETGLCVAFNTTAEDHPELLSVSEFPVFTMYAHKICLPTTSKTPCKKDWAFQMVPDAELQVSQEKLVAVRDVSECRTKCRDETQFVCRSGVYQSSSNMCSLSSFDRLSSSPAAFHHSPGSTYLENTCATEITGVCDFKPIRGKILKTVDSVYQDVLSREQCQEMCVKMDTFTCRSYDFGVTGTRVCRLSHHMAATLSHVREPYLQIEDAAMYEMTACYNVSVTCGEDRMIAHVRTSKMFNGKIYTKSRPYSCIRDVRGKLEFELSIGYNDVNCDVERNKAGHFITDLILQHHDRIVTSTDIGLQVRCRYDMANTTVHQRVNMGVQMVHQAYAEDELVGAPNVSMRITDQRGGDISSAKVGDPLALRFEILDKRSPYEIFVRELVAMDGQDTSEILLIDSEGCPTDVSIMQAVVSKGSANTLQANFDAFKFPTSPLVQFRALVTPCMPRCDPAQCGAFNSFGRRKREVAKEGGEGFKVANAITIVDTFDLVSERPKSQLGCVLETRGSLVICLAVTIFLVTQGALIILWARLKQR